jgi:hypothetical protein
MLLILVLFVLQYSFASQIHIAQGRTYENMTISWISDTYNSILNWGKDVDLNMITTGYQTDYQFEYADSIYNSKIIHHVTLTNLEPSTVYYYKCNNTTLLQFKTLSDDPGQIIGIIGDLGQTNDSISTLKHVFDSNVSLVINVGDLSYADCNQNLWDSYGEMIEPIASKIPWMVGPGNHEIEISNNSLYLAFESRYKMPSIKGVEYGNITIAAGIQENGQPFCCSSVFQSEYNWGNSFYSFTTGLIHFIYLNPYSVSSNTSVQYKWLVSDFLSINRTATPWIIVINHCPWYSSNIDHYAEEQTILMRESMEHLFYKNKVNMVLSGHVHAYERTHPVYKNVTDLNGPIYITIGNGGNLEGHAYNYYEQPSWSAYRNGTQYGHGEIKVINNSVLQWNWFRNIDGEIVYKDEYILHNII